MKRIFSSLFPSFPYALRLTPCAFIIIIYACLFSGLAYAEQGNPFNNPAKPGGGTVDTSGTPVANDFARFTDADTIEGRSYAEAKADLDLEIGTDVLAQQTIGIADDNLMEVDDAAAADNEYAKFTANGLEGRSYAETVEDLGIIPMNLITNSGFGVWSNSDTNKGLGSMNYDGGTDNDPAADTPDVGDAVTGDTSGATCKIIAITTATGAWADDDATGVLTLGACTGRFQDNETVSFSDGEDATVNMPNSAAGVDLLQNGDFSANDDPPDGWTKGKGDETLSTEAAGQVGNCMMITSGATDYAYAYQSFTTVIGKLYTFNGYHKQGTSTNLRIYIANFAGGAALYNSGDLTDAAWTQLTHTFEATAATTVVSLLCYTAGLGETSYFDEVSLYEITPNMTSGTAGPDGTEKTATLDVYRIWGDATYNKDGSQYSLMAVKGADSAEYLWWPKDLHDKSSHYLRFDGRTVTEGVWVYSVTATDNVKAAIYENGAWSTSTPHAGAGAWEWMPLTKTVTDGTTDFRYGVLFDGDTGDIAYISQPQLSFASSLPEGGYMQPPGEWVSCDKAIAIWYNTTPAAADDEILYLEALSEGMLPKGAITLDVTLNLTNSNVTTNDGVYLRATDTSGIPVLNCSPLVANFRQTIQGIVQCDSNGDVWQEITEPDATLSEYFLFINRIQVAP